MVRRILRYAVIARVLGVLLLAAAALKVQGRGSTPCAARDLRRS